jgi:hypothetical protein
VRGGVSILGFGLLIGIGIAVSGVARGQEAAPLVVTTDGSASSEIDDLPLEAPTPDPRWKFSGYVEQDGREGFPHDGSTFLERNRSILGARFELTPSAESNVRAVGDGRFLWLGNAQAQVPDELSVRGKTAPYRIDGDALFAEVSRIGGTTARLRAGRQSIRWGSGLLFNPTTVVNPPDLEDPLRFGSPMGTEMLRADASAGGVHAEAVFVPAFRPALLPQIDSRAALSLAGNSAASAIAADPSWTIAIDARGPGPRPTFDNAQEAVRVSGRIPVPLAIGGSGVDAAAMFYRGRTAIPQLATADLTADFVAKSLTGTATLDYPRIEVFGGDLAWQVDLPLLGGAAAWAEGAWVVPEPRARTVTVNGSTAVTTDFRASYPRAVAGADHTTAGGFYLALEYVRGFVNEFGAPAQGNYAFAIADRPLFRERLHVRLVGGLSLDDRSALLAPQIDWTVADAVTVTIGGYGGIGLASSKFGNALTGPPVAFARARLSF